MQHVGLALIRQGVNQQRQRAAFLDPQVHAEGAGRLQDGRLLFLIAQVSLLSRCCGHEHH